MTKDAVLFGGTDPGRFCPTYIIFCESFTPHHCQPKEDQNFDRRDVYIITQNALATALTSVTSARTTTAARKLIPRSSKSCSGPRSRIRITRPTCSPGRWPRWTDSLPRWAPGWKNDGALTPRGSPTRTLLTCPGLRPGCAPDLSRTRCRSTSMTISAPTLSGFWPAKATRLACAGTWLRT